MTRLGLVAGVLGGPRPALHQPAWADEAERDQVAKALRDLPPLVFAGEA